MKIAAASNDNGVHPYVDDLKNAIETVEKCADEFSEFDFAEVHRLYEILKNMVEE